MRQPMFRFVRLGKYVTIALLLALTANLATSAQVVDRDTLLQEISTLKEQLKNTTDPILIKSLTAEISQKEQLFLAPSAQDLALYANFLKNPDAGVIRLMPREKFQNLLNLNEGGSFFSFAGRHHEYNYGSDIYLEGNRFGSGVSSASFGMMLELENRVLDEITLEERDIQWLKNFTPPLDAAGVRQKQSELREGLTVDGFTYTRLLPAEPGRIFVLRSIGYGVADMLIAFENFRTDTDGSRLIAWKLLKRYPTPQLTGDYFTSVSAAGYQPAVLAPGSIVAAFGNRLSTGNFFATTNNLPTRLGNVSIVMQDSLRRTYSAPLFVVTPNQINYLVPPDMPEGYALIWSFTPAGPPVEEMVYIAKTAPGLFSANANGQGVAAAVALRVNDNFQSYENVARFDSGRNKFVAVPISLGTAEEQVFLVLFGTGIRGRTSLEAVSVKIGGIDLPVLYAGSQGGNGLDQINVLLPRELAGRGDLDISLTVHGRPANVVRINIQ